MAPLLSYPPDINKHLALVNYGKQTAGNNLSLIEQLKTTPLFSSKLLAGLNTALLPQYGLMGMRLETYGKSPLGTNDERESTQHDASDDSLDQHQQPEDARDLLVYANTNAPWSTFICGSQGSGKSHTLSCMLENSLMVPSGTGRISSPLTGLVLHYDKFTGIDTGQLCEAAYLCSSGVPVRVLVSPSSFTRMKMLYSNLPGLPQGVEPWGFEEGTLTIIDLSCPFVDENDACALFNICLGIFLESRDKGGRIVALDEAHKSANNTLVLEHYSSRSDRVDGNHAFSHPPAAPSGHLRVIATQEPTLSPNLLDLCNVTIVHRFTSPAWFKVLKGHLAGAIMGVSESKTSQYSADNIFSRIVCLKTGEALIFSPSSILDVDGPPETPAVTTTERRPAAVTGGIRPAAMTKKTHTEATTRGIPT